MSAGPPLGTTGRAAIGAICGLAWAGSLRTYMAAINTAGSRVDWIGTFVGVLLPGLLVGAALGVATVLDVSGPHRRRMRWLAASPLLLALLPMVRPGALEALAQGFGGGAVGVALAGIAGGYALGGGPHRPARAACGVLAAVASIAVAATVPMMGGRPMALDSPRGAWMTVLALSLMAVLCMACAIPFRRLAAAPR